MIQRVLQMVLGLVLLLGGGFFLWVEMRTPPTHNQHIYLFAGAAAFGAILMDPKDLLAVAKQVIATVQPLLPWNHGKKDDAT